jgi:hypothetical protein
VNVNCQQRQDDILLYAAGALEDPERSALLAHLSTGCSRCAGELAEAQATWALVGLSAMSTTAVPAGAKAKLDGLIEGSADGVGSPERDGLRMEGEPEPLQVAGEGMRIGRSAERRGGGAGWGKMLLAASVGIALTAGVSWLTLGTSWQQAERRAEGLVAEVSAVRGAQKMVEDELTAATASIEEFKARLADADSELAKVRTELTSIKSKNEALDEMVVSLRTDLNATRKVAEMLYSKQLLTLDLKGQTESPDAQARLLVDLQNKIWKLYATDLKPLDGRVYEFWLITADGAKVPMGSFTVDEKGQGTLNGIVPDPLPKLAAAAVSDEPGPGAKEPTGTLHVIGQFQ